MMCKGIGSMDANYRHCMLCGENGLMLDCGTKVLVLPPHIDFAANFSNV